MKKIFLSLILLSSYSFNILCMETKKVITLPSAEILNKRLNEKGFDHFNEKTKLGNKLGGSEKYPLGVAMAVELAIYDYSQTLPSIIGFQMQMNKPIIIKTILQDNPEAIENLKNHGVIEK